MNKARELNGNAFIKVVTIVYIVSMFVIQLMMYIKIYESGTDSV